MARQNITRREIKKAILEKRGRFERNESQPPKKRIVSSSLKRKMPEWR